MCTTSITKSTLLLLKSKFILDKILNDKDLVKKIQMFILTERALVSDDYINSYLEIDKYIASILETEKLDIRVAIIKSDGQYFFDNTYTNFGVVGIQNHNSRPEVLFSINHFYGNPVSSSNLNKYPTQLKKMVSQGYGLSVRSSSTNKKIQCYVAKVYSDDSLPLNENIFILRVSIPTTQTQPLVPINKELVKSRKIIKKPPPQPPKWLKTGNIDISNVFEVTTFLLSSALGANASVMSDTM